MCFNDNPGNFPLNLTVKKCFFWKKGKTRLLVNRAKHSEFDYLKKKRKSTDQFDRRPDKSKKTCKMPDYLRIISMIRTTKEVRNQETPSRI